MAFIGINIIFLLVLYFVGDKLYIKGLTSDSGSNQTKKETKEEDYKISKSGVMSELIKKEWRTIKRTPIFMLNTVVINLIIPIFFAVSFVASFNVDIDLYEYINLSNSGILLIVIGAFMFLSSASSSTSSAISREGNSARVLKTLPISLKIQLDAKVYFAMIFDLIGLVALEAVAVVTLNIPVYYFLIVDVPIIILMLIVNYLSILIDLRKPRLDWVEESEAVKQNFNVFVSMILTVLVGVVFVVLGVFLFDKNINIYLTFTIISVLLLATYVGLMIFINKNQNRLFNKVG